MRNIIFALPIILTLLISQASSGTTDKELLSQGILRLSGPVDESWLEKFQEAQERVALKEILLDSPGGYFYVARELAEKVRALGLNTRVSEATSRCESACVLVFMAGLERRAHRQAQFLFHGAAPDESQGLGYYGVFCYPVVHDGCSEMAERLRKTSHKYTELLFDALEQYGLSPQLRSDFFARPWDPDWVINANPLQISEWIAPARSFRGYNLFTQLL